MSDVIRQDLSDVIKANHTLIQIISTEADRIEGMAINAAKDSKRNIYKWNLAKGLFKFDMNNKRFVLDSPDMGVEEVLEWFEDNSDCVLLLEDFYPFMDENNSVKTISSLRQLARDTNAKSIIFSQGFAKLPKELEKEVHVINLDLPSKEDLGVVLRHVCKKFNVDFEDIQDKDMLLESALGLTIMEAKKAYSVAIIQSDGNLSSKEVDYILKEKERIIKNSGFLDYYHHKESLKDVGGLKNLKDWLKKRGRAFEASAKDYGLEYPRGVLLLGIPGTGKSLCAKAIGSEWKRPIIKLDMGRIFGGIVGESESNVRKALQIAEALSPCVLWIDEIEKGFSGLSSSGASDGGTTSRVLGTFLTWMQEKKKPVFVVATANDISKLPPELLRKGRIDEIFFVDLPSKRARKEIIQIHLERIKRKPSKFNLESLSESMEGFAGAEIEESIKEALFQSYDEAVELNDEYIIKAAKKTYPISRTMSEGISNLRKWAKERAVLADEEYDGKAIQNDGKNVVLKQEAFNPFIS